jgi:hypothetical protein
VSQLEYETSIKDHAEKGVTGGADGVRTRDLIDAIDARSQLRYGPTVERRNSLITSGSRAVKQSHS